MNWRDEAACLNHDPDLWFQNEDDPDTLDAIRVCNTECPVAKDCLEYALEARERSGVWGGLTSTQRDRVRRGLPAVPPEVVLAPCGTKSARDRHRRNGERCSVCSGGGSRVRVAVCGTRSGFMRHKGEGSVPCGACREVERTYQRERGRRRRAAERGAA